MPRYKAIIEYDGSNFRGFQYQPDLPTIQNSLEQAIYKISGEKTGVFAAGRTDSGVHALGQVIHFDLEKNFTNYQLVNGLNFHLRPEPIVVIEVEEVTEEFHARFSATQRHYRYLILNRMSPSVIQDKKILHVKRKINMEFMQLAASYLIGEHDFTSFRSKECQAKSPIRTISNINIEQNREIISIEVSARSFLHHMVRNIVGSLVFVGVNKWHSDRVKNLILARDRSLAAPTVASHGLYFMKVEY